MGKKLAAIQRKQQKAHPVTEPVTERTSRRRFGKAKRGGGKSTSKLESKKKR